MQSVTNCFQTISVIKLLGIHSVVKMFDINANDGIFIDLFSVC